MIRDLDPTVVCNAICALDEILKDEGGIATNKALIIYLLKKVRIQIFLKLNIYIINKTKISLQISFYKYPLH